MSKIQQSSDALPERLTTSQFWDSCYFGRELQPFNDQNWKNFVSIQLVQLLTQLKLDEKMICEVGGGDAEVLAYLAKLHPSAHFSVLDFSPAGCALAGKRAIIEGVELNVHQADMFYPPQELINKFDLVISHGVVEHFSSLSEVMVAKSRLVNEQGKLFTLIPNFSSPLYALLCKHWSKSVYEDHVAHTMQSFIAGHEEAGLQVTDKGYLGAMEFGMLSMAMNGSEPKTKLDRQVYLWLTRLSKVLHYFEYHFAPIPAGRLLSPFMYIVSTKA